MPFITTPQHSAIFSHFTNPQKGNLVINAVAGSGKTTTIIELQKLISLSSPDSFLPPAVLFLAFNRNIADTLKTRCPKHVNCSTFHSMGLRAFKQLLKPSEQKALEVNANKCSKILYKLTDKRNPDFQNILRLVSLAKSQPKENPDYDALIESHSLSFSEDDSFALAVKVFNTSRQDLSTIDFDDMLYLPVVLNAPFDTQDYVFIDEAQDTNDIQLEILERLRGASTKFTFVGDPFQAIYAFRGANADSMERIEKRFHCTPFPLSVSYRCPQLVVEEARRAMLEFANL